MATTRDWKRGKPQWIERPDLADIRQTVDDNGWTTSQTDVLGYTTTYQRDSMGRLTRYIPSKTQQQWLDTTISYSFSPQPVQTITKGGAATTITYDTMFRPTLEKTQAGSWVSYVNTDYDALGRVVFRSQPHASPTWDEGVETAYDALGRKTEDRETVAPFATTTYSYHSANRTRVTDPAGHTVDTYRYGWDGPGKGPTRKIYRKDRGAGGVWEKTYTTRNVWGELDYVLRLGDGTAPDSSQRLYYDAQSRLCRYQTTEGNSTLMAYNAAGEMVRYSKGMPNAAGCAAPSGPSLVDISNRDAIGRVKHVNFTDPATPDIYKYYNKRDLTNVQRGGANWAYYHNELGIRYAEYLQIDGRSFNTYKYFNTAGNEYARRYPSGDFTYSSPDGLGRMTIMRHRRGTGTPVWQVHDIRFHPNGAMSGYKAVNGITHTQTLDARQLPLRNEVYRVEDGVRTFTAMDLTYTYDARGKVTRIADGVDADQTRDFTYDGLGQLVAASGAALGQGAYTYDLLGNLRAKTVLGGTLTLSYDADNRLSGYTSTRPGLLGRTYAHDSRGNVVRRGDQDFTYDYSDQPVRAEGANGAGVSTYRYDGNLRRVKSVVDGKTMYSVYLSDGELVHTYDVSADNGAGDMKDFVRGNGRLLAVYTDGVPEYAHTDHLGTVQTATTASGVMRPQEYYTPFGEPMDTIAQAAGRPEQDLGLTGHLRDKSTGLTYMQARYYDPVVGRFLSIDPVTFMDSPQPGQFNRYAYTWNDPINATDPTGRVVKFNGDEDYNKQAAADLEAVRNSSPENAAMVGGLEASDHVHTIQPATGNDGVNGAAPTNQEGASTPGEGSGSTVYYDPNNTQTRHGDTRPPAAGLGHELGHSEEFDAGAFEFQDINDMVGPEGIVPPSGLTPKHEIGPIMRENDVRRSLGAPTRGCYTRTCGGG